MLEDFRELQVLADEGNEVAVKVIAWFDAQSDWAVLTDTFPASLTGVSTIRADAARTTLLFWSARLLRWLTDHPGQEPTGFTFTLGVEFL